jgi:hypothetical protein
MQVGHDLNSYTNNLHISGIPNGPTSKGRRIVIDTPGFDDTYVDNKEILRRIAVRLASSWVLRGLFERKHNM